MDPLQQAAKADRAERVPEGDAQPKRDIIDKLGDFIVRNYSEPGRKWGAGHVAAMWRAGLKELSQILPAFNNGIQPVEEPGLAGVPTNIEVMNAKVHGAEHTLESQVKGIIEPPKEPWRGKLESPAPERSTGRERG